MDGFQVLFGALNSLLFIEKWVESLLTRASKLAQTMLAMCISPVIFIRHKAQVSEGVMRAPPSFHFHHLPPVRSTLLPDFATVQALFSL